MTTREAAKLAHDAFGEHAAVCRRRADAPGERFIVGLRVEEGFGVIGKGRSWEAAFRDAEQHLAKQSEAAK